MLCLIRSPQSWPGKGRDRTAEATDLFSISWAGSHLEYGLGVLWLIQRPRVKFQKGKTARHPVLAQARVSIKWPGQRREPRIGSPGARGPRPADACTQAIASAYLRLAPDIAHLSWTPGARCRFHHGSTWCQDGRGTSHKMRALRGNLASVEVLEPDVYFKKRT